MKDGRSSTWIGLIEWVLAYEWLQSGISKFTDPSFMLHIHQTLATFASKTQFSFYATFLSGLPLHHAWAFGQMVRVCEALVGMAFLIGGYLEIKASRNRWLTTLVAVGAYGAALLNLNFYLGASFSGESTAGINVVMGAVAIIIGAYCTQKARVRR